MPNLSPLLKIGLKFPPPPPTDLGPMGSSLVAVLGSMGPLRIQCVVELKTGDHTEDYTVQST